MADDVTYGSGVLAPLAARPTSSLDFADNPLLPPAKQVMPENYWDAQAKAGRLQGATASPLPAPVPAPLAVSGAAAALPLIEHYESGGRNILQQVVSPSISTAQGYYQITNSTWRDIAPRAGIDLGVYPTAMSAPKEVQAQAATALWKQRGWSPWAPYNPALARAIGWQGGSGPQRSMDLSLPEGFGAPEKNELAPPPAQGAATAPPVDAPVTTSPLALLALLAAGTHRAIPVPYDPFKLRPDMEGEGDAGVVKAPAAVSGVGRVAAARSVTVVSPGLAATPAVAAFATNAPRYVTRVGMRSAY